MKNDVTPPEIVINQSEVTFLNRLLHCMDYQLSKPVLICIFLAIILYIYLPIKKQQADNYDECSNLQNAPKELCPIDLHTKYCRQCPLNGNNSISVLHLFATLKNGCRRLVSIQNGGVLAGTEGFWWQRWDVMVFDESSGKFVERFLSGEKTGNSVKKMNSKIESSKHGEKIGNGADKLGNKFEITDGYNKRGKKIGNSAKKIVQKSGNNVKKSDKIIDKIFKKSGKKTVITVKKIGQNGKKTSVGAKKAGKNARKHGNSARKVGGGVAKKSGNTVNASQSTRISSIAEDLEDILDSSSAVVDGDILDDVGGNDQEEEEQQQQQGEEEEEEEEKAGNVKPDRSEEIDQNVNVNEINENDTENGGINREEEHYEEEEEDGIEKKKKKKNKNKKKEEENKELGGNVDNSDEKDEQTTDKESTSLAYLVLFSLLVLSTAASLLELLREKKKERKVSEEGTDDGGEMSAGYTPGRRMSLVDLTVSRHARKEHHIETILKHSGSSTVSARNSPTPPPPLLRRCSFPAAPEGQGMPQGGGGGGMPQGTPHGHLQHHHPRGVHLQPQRQLTWSPPSLVRQPTSRRMSVDYQGGDGCVGVGGGGGDDSSPDSRRRVRIIRRH